MTRETVLVTGGAGFIGSHLVERLVAEGFAVRVLDDLSTGRRAWLPREADLVEGSIVEPGDCHRAMRGVAGVFHLAAMARSAPSVEMLTECMTKNVLGTENVLVAAREAGVRRFVYSASSTYYGALPTPHREDMPPDCMNPYALTKHVGEQLCALFHRVWRVPTITLRYFNVYGPRQPHEGAYALVLGVFLARARAGLPLVVHGDGAQRRDFVHVRDVVEANVRAYASRAEGVVLNVGSGVSVSIQELADRISKHQERGPARGADSPATLADLTRIEQVLGWRPSIAFDEGLAELLASGEG